MDYTKIDFAEMDILCAFSKLLSILQNEIGRLGKERFEIIRNLCKSAADTSSLRSGIKCTQDIRALVNVLTDSTVHCNCLQVNLLEAMAVELPTLSIVMKNYKRAIDSKTLGDVLKSWPKKACKVRNKYYAELKMEFKTDPDNLTVKQLYEYRPELPDEIIFVIQGGSVKVTWLIPANKVYQTYLSLLVLPQHMMSKTVIKTGHGDLMVFGPDYVLQEQRKLHGQ